MEEETITLTQAELDARVEEAVANATKDLEKKHSQEMYNARKEIKDLKNANLSQEELEKKVREEQDEAIKTELAELRSYKKQTILGEKLAKEGLPSYFKNDSRLITAEDGDLDRVVKDIKKEYEASLPKGTTISSVIQQSGTTTPSVGKSDKELANEEMGKFLDNILK